MLVLGYNPYVTNTVHRGHPFYPVQGSAEHPGLADQGKDPIELYETPRNMMGRNRFLRLAYGIFGRPGTAPYVEKDAQFMWPFAAAWRDVALYYFHDVRIGGFGPWFSGLLLLSLLLGVVGCARGVFPTGRARHRGRCHRPVAARQHPHVVGAIRPAPLVAARAADCRGPSPRRLARG